MLLVYTHKITPRLTYVFKHICTRMLGLPVAFTTKVEEIVAHEGPKLSYTHKQLGNELHLKSGDLLFEQGINDVEIKVSDWDGCPCFFPTSETDVLPFDIFAATFYLLSRYEEYLPHVKDEMGRYPATESLAYEHKFLKKPVVDFWAQRLGMVFMEHYPELQLKKEEMTTQVTIAVPQAFAYRKLGFLRTFTGFFGDFFKLRLRRNFTRLQVLLGLRKDPYDTFSWLVNIQKQTAISFHYFFELGNYSEESKNIKFSKVTFRSLMKMVGDYSQVGLLVSKHATESVDQLKEEKMRLENIMHRPLESIQVGRKLLTLPETYRLCLEQEIKSDYSLCYPGVLGFRAGTCTPFLFYDLDYEIQTPLYIQPICAEDATLVDERRGTIDAVSFRQLRDEVKEVGGSFVVGFSNISFMHTHAKQLFKQTVFHEAQ